MLKKERQALILEKLNKEQRIRVKPLSCELNTARTYRYAGLEDIDYLVTEEDCTEQILASWPACGYKVL